MVFDPSNPSLRKHEMALIVRLRTGKSMDDLIQIAKVEGAKLLKCKRVKVTEFHPSYLELRKFVVVVQNADVGMRNMKPK